MFRFGSRTAWIPPPWTLVDGTVYDGNVRMGWAFEQDNMHFSVKQKKSPQRRLSTSQEGYSPCGRDCEAEAAEAQLRRTPVVGSHPPGTKKVAPKATVYVPGGILSLRSRLRSGSCRSTAPTNPRRGFSPSWNEKSRPKGDCLRPRRDSNPRPCA